MGVGGICYIIGISLLILFVESLKLEVNLANVFSSLLTIGICYILNSKFVFEGGRHSKQKEILAFFIVSGIGFFINIILLYLFTKHLPIWYVISKTMVIMIVAVFNFYARKRFVFLK
ncbi:GtrA family protein [Pseudozobellia sp. WGM2]|uniref:GtrA family protein n=1 Tax=Pseudozobellia sp. WGM2 TaxID=2787625 RepID=UPI00352D2F3D